MTGVDANVNIVVNTQKAIAQIQGLQKQINALNRTLAMTGGAQDMRRVNQGLIDAANATGQFKASLVPVTSSVDQFTQKLEKNKFTLGEYTRYVTSQLPGMSRAFRTEFETMQQVAESRVRKIATAYTALGEATGKAQKALALTPTGALDLKNHAVQAEIAAQRQAIFNKMLSDGSTRMLNWGKNTQWAGRQLMVGFSIPLAMLGTTAAKTFAELDKASISFKRVYGDLSTTTQEMERNLQAVKDLGVEYTKYGIAVSDTIDLAARAAATGAQNETLMAATKETLRLATLGQMDYNTALDATISMQTAFKSSNEDLATNIDFLNAVENQTVLTLQDMALAIPRVAPVVKGLGGDVKDLAIMMTAMREGGISAENGANALKSGLASLINPTKRAQETLDKFGIDLKGIIANTRGDVLATVQEFGKALSSLDQFSQQQALEQIFGKYQYARMGALFSNIINDSGQAARAMDLAGESAQNLAALSDKELSKISEATSVKFQAAMEKLKVSISPIGEQFMKAVMPIMDFLSKLFDKFNEMPDIVKNVVVIGSAALAGLGPVILMSIGLLANGLANITKGALLVRNAFQRLTGTHRSFQYIAAAELEATTATAQLEGKMGSLTGVMLNQQGAISRLIALYSELATAASVAAGRMPTTMGGAAVATRAAAPRVRANRGLVMVPGSGNTDTIPALLTPGESVMTKSATKKYAPILQSMNAGTLPGFFDGVENVDSSHMMGLTTSTLSKSLISGLDSDNELLRSYIKEQLSQSSIAGFGVKGKVKSPEELIDKYIATRRFSGTAMASSSNRNRYFLESSYVKNRGLPSGEALILDDFLTQVAIAEEVINDKKTKSTIRSGAKSILDELEDMINDGILKRDSTGKIKKAPGADLKFLRKRLISMAVHDELVRSGKVNIDDVLPTAQKNAEEKIKQMKQMGIISPRGKIKQNLVTPYLAASALSNEAVFTRSSRKGSTFKVPLMKEIAQGRIINKNTQAQEIINSALINNKDIKKKIVLGGRGRLSRYLPRLKGFSFYANGGLVSGSGNKDTVPALLTPGESVITKEATAKYGPILQAMNKGKVRGFAEGDVDIDNEILSGQAGHFTRSQRVTDPQEVETMVRESRDAAIQANRSVKEYDEILQAIVEGRKVEAKLYTNAIANIPNIANADMMTGEEFGIMLSGAANRSKMMDPLIDQIAKEMKVDVAQLRSNPDFMRAIDSMAEDVGVTLAQRGGDFVTTDDFNNAFNAAIDKKISTGQFSPEESAAIESVRTRKTRAQYYIDGRKKGGRKSIPGAGVAPYGMGGLPEWEGEFMTEQGIAARKEAQRRESQSSRRKTTRTTANLPDVAPTNVWDLTAKQQKEVIVQAREEAKRQAFLREKDKQNWLTQRRQALETEKLLANKQELIDNETEFLKTRGLDDQKAREIATRNIESGVVGSQIAEQRRINRDQELQRLADEANEIEQVERQSIRERRQERQEEARRRRDRIYRNRFGRALGSSGRFVGRHSMGLGMGLGMASALPLMLADEQGKFAGMDANALSMGMGGASMLLSFAPALGAATPFVAGLAAAAGAAAFGIYKWRDSVDSAAREAADFGANLGGTANALSNMASILGAADPITLRQYQQLSIVPEEQEAFAQYSQMLTENEEGQKFIEELKAATSQERFTKLTDYLRNAVASEMLTQDQAKLFAKAVGAQLGDVLLGIRAGAEVSGQRAGSVGLMELAQQREIAAQEAVGIQKTIQSTAKDSLDASEASATVSAGVQIIKAYNQAIAKAQQEYQDGQIEFNTLVDTVNNANTAIGQWEKNIKIAYENVNDFGALMQGSERALDLAGVGEEQKKAMKDAYSEIWNEIGYRTATVAGATERFVTAEQEILPALGTEGAFQKLADLAERAGFERNIQGVQQYVESDKFNREAFNEIAEYGKNLLDVTRNDMLQIAMNQTVAERGLDPLEAVSMMKTIATDMTAMNAFVEGGSTVESFMNAIVVANSEIMFSSKELQQSFMDLSSQLDITGQSEAFGAYLAGAENKEQRETRIAEIQAVGAGMSPGGALAARSGYLATKTVAGKYYDEETVLRLQQTQAYQQALQQTKTTVVGGGMVPKTTVTDFDDKELREINEAIDKAGEAGISGDIVEYALKISVEEEKDPSKTIEEFTEKVLNLQGLDEEIRIALGIDINDGEDVSKFGDDVDAIERGWSMLSALNPNIDLRFAAKAAILDENGNPIDDPAKIAKNIMAMNKAYAALEKTGGGKSKKEAQIELVRQFQTETTILDEEGKEKEITPEQIVNDANKTLKKIGKSIDDLPAAKASQVLQIQTSISDKNAALNAKLAGYMAEYNEALADVAAATTPADRASAFRRVEAIGINIANTQKQARDNKKEGEAQILTTGIGGGGTPSGSGGGGGAESPLKGFKQGILDQVKMWVDANAQMSDLNNAKKNFVQSLLKGNSIFAQLNKVKGIDVANLQDILGMGPKGAMEFIKKYVKDGKLVKEGARLLQAANLAGVGETIGENIIAKRTARTQVRATNILRRREASQEAVEAIAGDPKKAARLVALQKEINAGTAGAEKEMDKLVQSTERKIKTAEKLAKTLMSPAQLAAEEFSKYAEQQNAFFDKQFADIETNANLMFKADYGRSVAETETIIRKNEDLIDAERDRIQVVQDSIRVIETRQGTEKNYSDWGLEQIQKEIDRNGDLIKVLERKNEIDQRRIDAIQRESDLRSREIDVINRDLDSMSETEDKINEAYDKRLEALDEVTKINDRIIQQQQQQINLSRALSTGDVYEAAAAAQEMQASSAQFAADQFRASLEQGRENEIAGLRTPGGLTREQAEERIRSIEEQNYQASLRIRDIQDEIYNRQINEILPLKDTEYNLNVALEKVQDSIAVKQREIRDIERGKMEELQRQNDLMQEQIDDHLEGIKTKQEQVKNTTGQTRAEFEALSAQIEASNAYAIAQSLSTAEGAKQAQNLAAQWANVAKQIENAKNALSGKRDSISLEPLTEKYTAESRAKDLAAAQAAYDAEIARIFSDAPEIKQNFEKIGGMGIQFRNAGGMIKAYANGGIAEKDSVPAMLTPGEFVIRKAMVDKYGIPMFESLNQGSFSMPRYNTQTSSIGQLGAVGQNNTNVVAPMYNSYSVNVNVSNPSASADDIANRVMTKIKGINDMSIRRVNGY